MNGKSMIIPNDNWAIVYKFVNKHKHGVSVQEIIDVFCFKNNVFSEEYLRYILASLKKKGVLKTPIIGIYKTISKNNN